MILTEIISSKSLLSSSSGGYEGATIIHDHARGGVLLCISGGGCAAGFAKVLTFTRPNFVTLYQTKNARLHIKKLAYTKCRFPFAPITFIYGICTLPYL